MATSNNIVITYTAGTAGQITATGTITTTGTQWWDTWGVYRPYRSWVRDHARRDAIAFPSDAEIVAAWDSAGRYLEWSRQPYDQRVGTCPSSPVFGESISHDGRAGRIAWVAVGDHRTTPDDYSKARSRIIRARIAADKERERNRVVCDHHPLDLWGDE